MPRVAIKKKDYMLFDLPFWLAKEAKKKGIRQKDLADALGITRQSFHGRQLRKPNGNPKDVFTYGELLTLFKLLELSDEEILKLMKL